MVANAHHYHLAAVGHFACVGRWHRSCSICVHPILIVQQTYRNILVLAVGFCLLHMLFKGFVFLLIATVVVVLSAISPKAAKAIEKGWLWIGGKMGAVNGAILLFIIYHFLLFPIALLSRISGKDGLRLKAPKASNFQTENHVYGPQDLKNPW